MRFYSDAGENTFISLLRFCIVSWDNPTRGMRGRGQARNGDGLQRSLHRSRTQMMNNGSAEMTFPASAGEGIGNSSGFRIIDDDPLEH